MGDISPRWDYNIGFAYLATDSNSQRYLEPRARIGFDVSDKHKLNISYGVHHTLVDDYQYLIPQYGESTLEASESTHYTLSLDSNLGQGLGLKTELFYKELDNLIVANPDAQKRHLTQNVAGAPTFDDVASGESYGIELLLNKQLSEDWYGWASIAYSKTERDNPLTNQQFNSEFDLPWVANLVLDYKWNENWQIGAKWRFQSGRRYTQVQSATPILKLIINPSFIYLNTASLMLSNGETITGLIFAQTIKPKCLVSNRLFISKCLTFTAQKRCKNLSTT
nr:TonB-dependent receptor [Ningiella sp. W23]